MVNALPLSPGVLAKDQLEDLVNKGLISGPTPPKIGASAIDLRLGSRAWRLKSGQRPTTRELSIIKRQSEEVDLIGEEYFEFKTGNIYIVQLEHHLTLPANVSGRASGKSSIGRLDVITRLITHESKEYDLVAAGYEGELHLLLMPQTFDIRVAPGKSLNQLRLYAGSHSASAIRREQLYDYGTRFWYILEDGKDDEYENWGRPALEPTGDPVLMDLTVDLGDLRFPYIFRAQKNVKEPIDLSKEAELDPAKFFTKVPVMIEGPDRSVLLDQGSFYIMKSRERLHIPKDVAVEVIAISERIGDIRIHYAGFAHPGFGLGEWPGERKGTPLIFEVRATDMPTKLYHRSLLARIQLFRMSKATDPDQSPYERQELKLSSVFAKWPENAT